MHAFYVYRVRPRSYDQSGQSNSAGSLIGHSLFQPAPVSLNEESFALDFSRQEGAEDPSARLEHSTVASNW